MIQEITTIIEQDEPILVTASNSFIGSKVVEILLQSGFTNLRCFVRPSSNTNALCGILAEFQSAKVEVIEGNLLSPDDCMRAARDVKVILHLAAGSAEKSFAGAFMNSVVTTRNLLAAAGTSGCLKRFVNVSSFAVYSNWKLKRRNWLDEGCALENRLTERADAYVFGKLKQEQLVADFATRQNIPFVILRPGAVWGPGALHINSRVGIGTFGVFLHLGGRNRIPFTYLDNCAEAIVRAGVIPGVDGEVFNVVDSDLPTSRQFLRMYKKYGKQFMSIPVPYWMFYGFCWMWESYSRWSKGQLPPTFNRRRCAAYWRANRYSNKKLRDRLGWRPIPFSEASRRYIESLRRVS